MKADVLTFTDGDGNEHTALIFNRNEHGADIIYIREPRLLSSGNWQDGLERRLNHAPEIYAIAPPPAAPEPQAAAPATETLAPGEPVELTEGVVPSVVTEDTTSEDGPVPRVKGKKTTA